MGFLMAGAIMLSLAGCGQSSSQIKDDAATSNDNSTVSHPITESQASIIDPAQSDEAIVRVNADGVADPQGEYILFGSYPQSLVTDEALASKLSEENVAVYGDPDSIWAIRNQTFDSDGHNIDIYYKDVEYMGERYRGVYFDQYRNHTLENRGEYLTGQNYWFKYEPIKWYIISDNEGNLFCLSERVLDSNCFYNRPYYVSGASYPTGNGGYYIDSSLSHFASNYVYSSIRSWLHTDFYDLAFSHDEKALLIETALDNSAAVNNKSINDVSPSLFSSQTTESVFLLSDYDINNVVSHEHLIKYPTDYAKCMGVNVVDENDSASPWWLRTVISPYVTSRGYGTGGFVNGDGANDSAIGVAPAITLTTDVNGNSERKIGKVGIVIDSQRSLQEDEVRSLCNPYGLNYDAFEGYDVAPLMEKTEAYFRGVVNSLVGFGCTTIIFDLSEFHAARVDTEFYAPIFAAIREDHPEIELYPSFN